MSYKFFYLFLAGGILGLLILIYQIVSQYPKVETVDAVFNAILVVVFFYMAYKVRREKEDKDLMWSIDFIRFTLITCQPLSWKSFSSSQF